MKLVEHLCYGGSGSQSNTSRPEISACGRQTKLPNQRAASECATRTVVNSHGSLSYTCWYATHTQKMQTAVLCSEKVYPLTHQALVFNNSSFEMLVVDTHAEAYGRTLRADPIDCGENIMLYRKNEALHSSWTISLRDEKSTINASATRSGH